MLIFLHLLVGQTFVAAVPAWEAPDEPWHLVYAEALAAGHLPAAEDTYEYHHPPLYYLWPALGLRAIGLARVPRAADNPRFPFAAAAYLHPAGAEDRAPMQLLRGLSGLLGGLAVALTWSLTRRVTRGRSDGERTALLAAGLVASLPQMAYVSHTVSNDGLATAVGAGLLYALLRWTEPALGGASPREAGGGRAPGRLPAMRGDLASGAVIGACLVLALLTKLNALVLVAALPPVLFLAAAADVRCLGRPRAAARAAFGAALSMGILAAAAWALRAGLPGVWQALIDNIVGRGIERQPALSTPRELLLQSGRMLDHVWGRYGWFNILSPSWMRRTADALALLALLGLLPAWRAADGRLRRMMGVALIFGGLALGAGVRNLMSDPQPQARLLFPALAAAALLLSLGVGAALARLPRRWRGPLAALPVAGLLVLGLYATQIRLPQAFAPSRRAAPVLDTRMLPPTWGVVARLEGAGALAEQSLRPYREGLSRIELPVLVAGGSGRLSLALFDADGRSLAPIAQASWPLADLGRPAIDRPRIGPLADASWVGLDLAGDLEAGQALRLRLILEGEGYAWLPGASDGDAYPDGELRVNGEPETDLIFVSSLRD